MNFGIDEILDKANVKEFIAIAAGLVGSNVVDKITANMDAKQRDLVKVAVGLAGAFAANEFAERNPDYAELLGLLGLGLTTVGAEPVANRIKIEVSKAAGVETEYPIVVASYTEQGIETPPKLSAELETEY